MLSMETLSEGLSIKAPPAGNQNKAVFWHASCQRPLELHKAAVWRAVTLGFLVESWYGQEASLGNFLFLPERAVSFKKTIPAENVSQL